MIRYSITEAELWNRIDAVQPNWRRRTRARLNKFIAADKYIEASGIWGEIKTVYVQLQHSKCGYCEKWLEREDFGLVEQDVEHFRPKSRVRAYPPQTSDARDGLTYDFPTGDAQNTGYFHLAYHPLNYLTTCKTCNSTLKSDYFPVAKGRIAGALHPRDLSAEEPLLIYPLSDLDTAPESLIGFDGLLAIPIGNSTDERRRADVTIDFFQLNNREDLRRQRARVIHSLHVALAALPHLPSEELRREARLLINAQMSASAMHANCSRCFVRLFQTDAPKAALHVAEASALYPAPDPAIDPAPI